MPPTCPSPRAAILLVALIASPLPMTAQEPAARQTIPASGAAWLPLQAGQVWKYRITTTSAAGEKVSEQVIEDFGEVPAPNGTCHQWLVTTSHGTNVTPEYWSADATGIWHHQNRHLGGLRGVGSGRTRLLAAPIGAETRWTWEHEFAYQTSGVRPRDAARDTVRSEAELVALDATVQVPAGEFRALHVRITSTLRRQEGAQVRELWFAKGVGIVKERNVAYGGTSVRELTEHAPAAAGAIDEEPELERQLRDDPRAAGAAPQVQWLERGEEACWLRGRFALATFAGGERAVFHVAAGKIVEAAAADLEFWRTVWQQAKSEPRVRAAVAPGVVVPVRGHDHAAPVLTGLYARVEGTRRGLRSFTAAGSETQVKLDPPRRSTCTVQFDCVDDAGEARRITAVATSSEERLEDAKLSVR